ncbi:MAG: class I tRNA ligase family protein, partial [Acidobacteriota bacterium]|nr:class I tRNA ligase family protein [Acidobacteriota bacterium]
MFRIHNTLTGIIEEFQPLEGEKVKMYACGPTVWNYTHLGNFRTFVFDDVLRRYLKFKGYDVTHVMNLTDVDDRIFSTAARLKVAPEDLTGQFIKAFWEDLESLNCERPEIAPLAGDHIAEMISLIENLVAKDCAYISEGSVYYRIASFPEYGKLSNLKSENLAGSCERIDT